MTSLLLQQQQTGLDEDDNVRLFQDLIDTGMAWRLEGAIGREAMSLINCQGLFLQALAPIPA